MSRIERFARACSKNGTTATLGFALFWGVPGCSTGPENGARGGEGVVQQALGRTDAPVSEPSSSSPSTVTLAWTFESPLAERSGDDTYALAIENTEDSPVKGEIDLQLYGLGAHRKQKLSAFELAAHERRVVVWSPASSPIAPWGTLARVIAQGRYTRGGLKKTIPAPPLFVSFSRDGARAFASVEDGELVRLASLGRRASPWTKGPVTSTDQQAQLAELGSRRGRLDGVWVDESGGDVIVRRGHHLVAKAAAPGAARGVQKEQEEEDVGDTLSREGGLEKVRDASAGVSSPAGAEAESSFVPPPIDPGPLPSCPNLTYPVTEPTCIRWRTTGFRDIGVAGPVYVPPETVEQTLENYQAAYANAAIYENGVLGWSGRLDGNGCTPAITYCPQNAQIDVSSSSLQRCTFDNTLATCSREILLTPGRTFTAQVVLASSTTTGRPIGAANVWPSTLADEYLLRVAAVLSRLLNTPDNGLRNGTVPPLNVHTETGCCLERQFVYTSSSGQSLCGEACAVASDAWFGQTLAIQPDGTYAPTTRHTTEDAYTIGHELGHSVQGDASGGPENNVGYGNLVPGNCSCDHVREGNRFHCLQSSHYIQKAESEGFAHFFATRIMNDKAANARFTYYKDVRRFAPTTLAPFAVAPPVPINAGTPAYDPVIGQTTGWVRIFCYEANHSSEYDWLTFLWAINGKPSTASLSMTEVFAILGSVAGGIQSYTWPNLREKAIGILGVGTPKFIRFCDEAQNNGTNL